MFGIKRRARSRKAKAGLRALLGRAPDAAEIGERLGRLARRMLGSGVVVDATAKRLTLDFHPAAANVRVQVLADGDLEITGETASVGPGYHRHVIAQLAPLLDELEYVWADEEPEPGAAMTAWLARELAGGMTRFGMPAELAFKLDAAVLTPLGPRDAAWRDAVIEDPSRAADAFAWWDDGPGRAERSRALLAMSLEIPWREPVDKAERDVMAGADRDLRAARKADRELVLPNAEWAELVSYLGDDERASTIRDRAGDAVSVLGYRRHMMEVLLDHGWAIDLPGRFVGAYEDERYWATDGDRVVELTCLTTNGEQDSDQLLAVAPEAHPVIERLVDGDRRGRAEAYVDGDVHVVYGLIAVSPEVAILTCKGGPDDESWALATWRSLRRYSVTDTE